MHIAENSTAPLLKAQHLFYAPAYRNQRGIFKLQHIEGVSQEALRNLLAHKAQSPLPFAYWMTNEHFFPHGPEWASTAPFMAALCTSIFFLTFSNAFAPYAPVSEQVRSCPYEDRCYYLVDAQGGRVDAALVPYVCDSSTKTYMHNLIWATPLLTFTVVMLGFEAKRLFYDNRKIANYNARLEEIAEQLSFLSKTGKEEAPPRDVCLTFPYLSPELLSRLNFPQLDAARQKYEGLFQERLDAGLYSVQQLACWRLFKHIVESNSETRHLILADEKCQRVVGRDVVFFQKLAVELNPLDMELSRIFKRILKHHILNRETRSGLGAEAYACILKRVSEGYDLGYAVEEILTHASKRAEEETDAYNMLLRCGKLVIHSIDACYHCYKQSLIRGDVDVSHWFESYLSRHLHFFANHPNLPSLLMELSALKGETLKGLIDRHLIDFHSSLLFDSQEFHQQHVLAIKHGLVHYAAALEMLFLKQFQAYILEGSPEAIVFQIQSFLNQLDPFSPASQKALTELLANKVDAWLVKAPHLIDEVSREALKRQNLWLLNCIQDIHAASPALYDSYWLSPLERVS